MTGNILHLTAPLIFTLHLISVHQECYLTQPAAPHPAQVFPGDRTLPGVNDWWLMEGNRGKSNLHQLTIYSVHCYFVIIYNFNLLTVKDVSVLWVLLVYR